jgi:hypothetical protein
MNVRVRSGLVIAKRQVLETILSPGLYISLSIGLALGFALVKDFPAAIDSSGFDPSMSPLYDFVDRALAGSIGTALAGSIFSQGPCLLALAVAFLPVIIFTSIASVFRFGLEKNAGAVELIAYGPADGASYLIAVLAKDIFISLSSLVSIAVMLVIGAGLGGLSIGSEFFFALPVIALLSTAILSYGAFFSEISRSAASALSMFLASVILFAIALADSLSIATGSAHVVATIAADIFQWFSPFYYAFISLRAFEEGNAASIAVGLTSMIVLSGGLFCVGHAIATRSGVRE